MVVGFSWSHIRSTKSCFNKVTSQTSNLNVQILVTERICHSLLACSILSNKVVHYSIYRHTWINYYTRLYYLFVHMFKWFVLGTFISTNNSLKIPKQKSLDLWWFVSYFFYLKPSPVPTNRGGFLKQLFNIYAVGLSSLQTFSARNKQVYSKNARRFSVIV